MSDHDDRLHRGRSSSQFNFEQHQFSPTSPLSFRAVNSSRQYAFSALPSPTSSSHSFGLWGSPPQYNGPSGPPPNIRLPPTPDLASGSASSSPSRSTAQRTNRDVLHTGGETSLSSGTAVHTQVTATPLPKKRALIIGINYFKSPHHLTESIGNASSFSAFLERTGGYAKSDTRILSDDQEAPESRPTKVNIIRAMHWLVDGAKAGDSLFFFFAGRGTSAPSHGVREILFPVDYKQSGYITDQNMHDHMISRLPAGSNLMVLFDSYHEFSGVTVPYIYCCEGLIKGPKERFQTPDPSVSTKLSRERRRYVSVFGRRRKDNDADQPQFSNGIKAKVITFSSFRESTIPEVQDSGIIGSMSQTFIDVVSRNPEQTYQSLLTQIDVIMMGRYQQRPHMGSSQSIDMKDMFKL